VQRTVCWSGGHGRGAQQAERSRVQMAEQLRSKHVAILVERLLIRCAIVTLLHPPCGVGCIRRSRLSENLAESTSGKCSGDASAVEGRVTHPASAPHAGRDVSGDHHPLMRHAC
jgi:hypothetical protein